MTSSPLYPQYLADGGMWKEGMEEGKEDEREGGKRKGGDLRL